MIWYEALMSLLRPFASTPSKYFFHGAVEVYNSTIQFAVKKTYCMLVIIVS
jgi:hypothetical protein